jgi:hypothetical protein
MTGMAKDHGSLPFYRGRIEVGSFHALTNFEPFLYLGFVSDA